MSTTDRDERGRKATEADVEAHKLADRVKEPEDEDRRQEEEPDVEAHKLAKKKGL